MKILVIEVSYFKLNKKMKTIKYKENVKFNKDHGVADPLFIDKNSRLLRFSLLPGQSIKEHRAPSSPVFIKIIEGRGLFWGKDGNKQEYDSNSIIIFSQNEIHGVSALDEKLVFIALLHGIAS